MNSIQRYTAAAIDGSSVIKKAGNGNLVFYSSHQRQLAEIQARIAACVDTVRARVVLARQLAVTDRELDEAYLWTWEQAEKIITNCLLQHTTKGTQ